MSYVRCSAACNIAAACDFSSGPGTMAEPDLFLFVSHVSEDRPVALEIVDELERRGVPCWIAPRDVRPGRPFDDEIAEAIEASRAMLLIFSERCNEHEYIRREITVAGESHKVIIPFRIENAQPRRGLRIRLSDLHWIDGFVSRERAIGQVVRTIDPDRARKQEEKHRAHEEKRRREEEEHRVQQQVEKQWLRQQQEEQRRQQKEEEHRRHEEEQRRRQQKAEEGQHSPKAEKKQHRAETVHQASELFSDQLPWPLKRRSQITLSGLSIALKLLVVLLGLTHPGQPGNKFFVFIFFIFPPSLATTTLFFIISKRTNIRMLYVLFGTNLLAALFFSWLIFTAISASDIIMDFIGRLMITEFSIVILASLIEISAVTFDILERRAYGLEGSAPET
jgi:TIR domain